MSRFFHFYQPSSLLNFLFSYRVEISFDIIVVNILFTLIELPVNFSLPTLRFSVVISFLLAKEIILHFAISLEFLHLTLSRDTNYKLSYKGKNLLKFFLSQNPSIFLRCSTMSDTTGPF